MKTYLAKFPELGPALKRSKDYREFLESYLKLSGTSYAHFSRRAGFSSRSFPRDVVTGKRRLSAKSFAQTQEALLLPATWKKYFRLLVMRTEPDLFVGHDLANVEIEIKKQKSKLDLERMNRVSPYSQVDYILGVKNLVPIYASLGEPADGATYEQIALRTGYKDDLLQASLKSLVQLNLAEVKKVQEEERFYPQSFHLSLSDSGKSQVFKKLFLESLAEANKRAQAAFDSEAELFFISSFCISKKDMPSLKKELRSVLLKYVDESIHCDGDQVVRLTAALNLPVE